MWLSLCMAALVLSGTLWFFRDQVRTAWLSYTLKDDDTAPAGAPAIPAPQSPPKIGDTKSNPAKSNPEPTATAPATIPSSSPLPKAVPVMQPAPAAPPFAPPASSESTQPTTVLPALPANPLTNLAPGNLAMVPAGGSLVEVPGAIPSGPPVHVVPSPPPVPALVTGVTPETQPALEALQKFFQAKTWGERLPFVQVPTSMKPLMEQYYGANPDGPLHPSHIQMFQHNRAPQTGPPQCVFQVSGGGLKQPLPLMVESTEEGWKVDWLTFTEFKDELLLKFLEAPQAEPARFHVLMRRAHYFDDDVPALDKKTCFQVMPPMPGFTGDVFAIKGTSVARELDKHVGWDVSQAAAVVELQWRKEERHQWVELTSLVQLNWRNVEPSVPKAAAVESDPPPAKK